MANYVQITRDDFEQWLDSLRPLKWSRAPGKEGVYLVFLNPSDSVAVHISSSVGSRDTAMARAKGAMYMRLVSTINGRTLNKKDVGQGKFYRTEGWRETLRKALDRLKATYQKSKAFYDKLAEIDPDAYKTDILQQIEAVSNWEQDALLRDFHERVERGGVLSTAQEAVITKAKTTPSRIVPQQDVKGQLDRLRNLWSAAHQRKDEWTEGFVQSIAALIDRGRTPSPKQQEILDKKFTQYRIASTTDLEQAWLSLAT